MPRIKDKIIDAAWQVANIGLSLVIQAPTEVARYSEPGYPIVNGKKFRDLNADNWDDIRLAMERAPAKRMTILNSSGPQVRRMIVFK